MSVELVNGHVLFSNRADWSENPRWRRTWESQVSPAVTGSESRVALRANARRSITYLITAGSVSEAARLDDRIRAAKKSGLACAPYHGRGYTLAAIAAGSSLLLDRPCVPSVPYVLLFSAAGDHVVQEVSLVDGADLTLAEALAAEHPSGEMIWPLLFGKFSCETLLPLTDEVARIRISISERTAAAAVQLGAVEAPAGAGVGTWSIGDTLIVQ